MRKVTDMFVDYVITESELIVPMTEGGQFTTEQRQLIIDELRRMAREFPAYRATLIRALQPELHELKGGK